jgi:Secretion system C-terminal sorting domain/PKD domain
VTDALGCTATDCVEIRDSTINCPPPIFRAEITTVMPHDTMYAIHHLNPNGIFIWDFGDGSATQTGAFPTHTYPRRDTFRICLTYTDPILNCTETFCNTMGIDGNNVIWRSGFTVLILPNLPLEVNLPLEKNKLEVFPNPSKGEIQIKIPLDLGVEIEFNLVNILGQSVKSIKFNNFAEYFMNLDLGEMADGTYQMVLKNNKKHYQSTIILTK